MIVIKTKRVEESKISVGNLMHPAQANHVGNVHGGEIVKLMDNTAGIVAFRHSKNNVVTARIDELEFYIPIHVGNLVTCNGYLTFVGKHSMEVFVEVFVEDFKEDGSIKLALTAFFTMVALDEEGNPAEVPPLEITTEEERDLFEEGRQRYLTRKNKRQARQ